MHFKPKPTCHNFTTCASCVAFTNANRGKPSFLNCGALCPPACCQAAHAGIARCCRLVCDGWLVHGWQRTRIPNSACRLPRFGALCALPRFFIELARAWLQSGRINSQAQCTAHSSTGNLAPAADCAELSVAGAQHKQVRIRMPRARARTRAARQGTRLRTRAAARGSTSSTRRPRTIGRRQPAPAAAAEAEAAQALSMVNWHSACLEC